MKKIFDNIRTVCFICGTPLNGKDLHERNNKYYCSADFERTSPEEKLENKRQADNLIKNRKIYDGTGT